MPTATRLCWISCLVAASATPALADTGDDVPPVTTAPDGQYAVIRGVQGPAGMVSARVLLDINLSTDLAGKPTSLAPICITARHRCRSASCTPGRWAGSRVPGFGLCLTGTPAAAPRSTTTSASISCTGCSSATSTFRSTRRCSCCSISDPTGVMWTIGLTGKFHFTDAVALFFDPQVGVIAVAPRRLQGHALFIPARAPVPAAAAVSFKVLSGVSGQLSALGDTYEVPLGLGLVGNVNSAPRSRRAIQLRQPARPRGDGRRARRHALAGRAAQHPLVAPRRAAGVVSAASDRRRTGRRFAAR